VTSHASWFMNPTMSTSPLAWSCTTAGIKPSSFEKSISIRGGRLQPVRTTKNPASIPAGSALRLVIREVLVSLRAQSCRTTEVAVVMMDVHVRPEPNH